MANDFPRLHADDRGVWREDKPDRLFGIEWSEIVSVVAYRLDGITDVYTIVELDPLNGRLTLQWSEEWRTETQRLGAWG
jgi:hypothetical protein